jgi:uncharacterized protein YkuJ
MVNLSIIYYFSGDFMKIRINRLQLMQGVTITHRMVDLKNENLKVTFYYLEDSFILIDYSDNKKLYTFDNYQSFRKKLTSIIIDW